MTNPAEKIRQVAQDHIRFLSYGTEAAEMFEPEQLVINALTARNLGKVLAQQMLDAIIEEMESQTVVESKLADSCVDQRTDYAFYSGKAQALSQMVENLRQARSDLEGIISSNEKE